MLHDLIITLILVHLVFSIMNVQSVVKRIEQGKISEDTKQKLLQYHMQLLEIFHGNVKRAEIFFVLVMFLGNFITFHYVPRFFNLFKHTKDDL